MVAFWWVYLISFVYCLFIFISLYWTEQVDEYIATLIAAIAVIPVVNTIYVIRTIYASLK